MNRRRIAAGVAGTLVVAGAAVGWTFMSSEGRAVLRGRELYGVHCASCHGAELQGEADWQSPRADGRLPAPPHNADGHTWHHADDVLVGIILDGLTPYAGADYKSNMPTFRGVLTESQGADIVAFLKSKWPQREREFQARVTGSSP